MADFVQTMKDWRRMCRYMTKMFGNNRCNMCSLVRCEAIYEDYGGMDYADVKNKVDAWAAEHPKPVYETWLAFIKRFETGGRKSDDDFIYWMGTTPIPADIAQKLGIKPKEGI